MKRNVLMVFAMFFVFMLMSACGGGGGGGTTSGNVETPTLKVPESPTNVTVIPNNLSSVTISFLEPPNGGSPITSYSVKCGNIEVMTPSSPVTITGLSPCQIHSFTIVARNAIGDSSPSNPYYARTVADGAIPFLSMETTSDGVFYSSLIQKADGLYFRRDGQTSSEKRILVGGGQSAEKFIDDLSGKYAYVFATNVPDKTVTSPGYTGEIFLVKVNKTDLSFSVKSLVTYGTFRDAALLTGEDYIQIIYFDEILRKQIIKKIDLDGNLLQDVPVQLGTFYAYHMGITDSNIYLIGDITLGSFFNRASVKVLSRDYAYLRDSQQRPFEATKETDYVSGFSMAPGGMLVAINFGDSIVTGITSSLFFVDLATGTWNKIHSIEKGGILCPRKDSQGNIFFISRYGYDQKLWKITPDGKKYHQYYQLLGGTTDMHFYDDDIVVTHYNMHIYSEADYFKPTPLSLFKVSTGWTAAQ